MIIYTTKACVKTDMLVGFIVLMFMTLGHKQKMVSAVIKNTW